MFQSKGIKYCICEAMMGTLSAWKVCKPCGHASCAQTNNSRAKLASYWTFNWYFHAYIYQTVCGYLPSFTWLRKRKGNAGAARKIYSLTRKIARQASWLRISIARASSFPAQSKLSSRRLIYICKYQPGLQMFYPGRGVWHLPSPPGVWHFHSLPADSTLKYTIYDCSL